MVKMFGKKKEKIMVDESGAELLNIPVYFGGANLGKILRIIAKEVKGQDHMELFIKLDVGSGIRPQLLQVLGRQGLYIGKPLL